MLTGYLSDDLKHTQILHTYWYEVVHKNKRWVIRAVRIRIVRTTAKYSICIFHSKSKVYTSIRVHSNIMCSKFHWFFVVEPLINTVFTVPDSTWQNNTVTYRCRYQFVFWFWCFSTWKRTEIYEHWKKKKKSKRKQHKFEGSWQLTST